MPVHPTIDQQSPLEQFKIYDYEINKLVTFLPTMHQQNLIFDFPISNPDHLKPSA
jgi:hypothetical protein